MQVHTLPESLSSQRFCGWGRGRAGAGAGRRGAALAERHAFLYKRLEPLAGGRSGPRAGVKGLAGAREKNGQNDAPRQRPRRASSVARLARGPHRDTARPQVGCGRPVGGGQAPVGARSEI